jgi:DNA-binding transcriptional regulator YiaG
MEPMVTSSDVMAPPLKTMTKEKLRSIREGLGLSLTDAAAEFNVGRRSYIRWESGERVIAGPAVVVADILQDRLNVMLVKTKSDAT